MIEKEKDTALILLAAGASKRLGKPKQLLKLGENFLINHIIGVMNRSAGSRIYVVLGAYADDIKQVLTGDNINVVFNPDWEKGLGSTIKTGLRAAINHTENLDSVVFLTVDQIELAPGNIDNLIELRKKTFADIVASEYDNTTGIPALFSKKFFPEILSLPDSQGCNSIIKKYSDIAAAVPFPGGGTDVDYPSDVTF